MLEFLLILALIPFAIVGLIWAFVIVFALLHGMFGWMFERRRY